MNRLVLIGNGFDLAHGLKTSYADFIDWYWKDWGRKLLKGLNKTEDDGLCSFKIKDNIEVQNWASVFQGWYYKRENPLIPWDVYYVVSLAKQDKKLCDFKMSPFFERIQNSIETRGWVDIENEYYRLLEYHALEAYSEQDIATLNKQLAYLQQLLTEYLTTINKQGISIIENVRKKIYAPIKSSDISIEATKTLTEYIEWCNKQETDVWKYKLYKYGINTLRTSDIDNVEKFKSDHTLCTEYPRAYMLPEQIMLLNFNYTKTANEYLNDYDIFSLNYIHGVLESPDSMIFGYGDEFEDKYKRLQNLNNNECLTNIKTIRYQESDNYRKVLAFIESAPFQVCIMGHSCGNSDRTLLNTIFEHRNCISIKPYYYIKDDGTDSYIELIQNISRNFTDMKLMRDRVVNKTYCETLT